MCKLIVIPLNTKLMYKLIVIPLKTKSVYKFIVIPLKTKLVYKGAGGIQKFNNILTLIAN